MLKKGESLTFSELLRVHLRRINGYLEGRFEGDEEWTSCG